jgi:hypothetical protein
VPGSRPRTRACRGPAARSRAAPSGGG